MAWATVPAPRVPIRTMRSFSDSLGYRTGEQDGSVFSRAGDVVERGGEVAQVVAGGHREQFRSLARQPRCEGNVLGALIGRQQPPAAHRDTPQGQLTPGQR